MEGNGIGFVGLEGPSPRCFSHCGVGCVLGLWWDSIWHCHGGMWDVGFGAKCGSSTLEQVIFFPPSKPKFFLLEKRGLEEFILSFGTVL